MALKGKLAKGVLPRPSSPDEDEILLHETDLLVFSGVSIGAKPETLTVSCANQEYNTISELTHFMLKRSPVKIRYLDRSGFYILPKVD